MFQLTATRTRLQLIVCFVSLIIFMFSGLPIQASDTIDPVAEILEKVREHDFSQNSGYDGVGDLSDQAWKVRSLVVRDLLLQGAVAVPALQRFLSDPNSNVRHVCTMTLGLLKAQSVSLDLRNLLKNDPDTLVRCEAALALGYLGMKENLPFLREMMEKIDNKDIKDRCKLSIGRIEDSRSESDIQTVVDAYLALDESTFRSVQVGKPALDFTLRDTKGNLWTLSELKGKTVVLIWIFADWCPVCHHEFHDLIAMEEAYKTANIQVMTVECHDAYRCQVMVNDRKLWWPHLVDNAGLIGSQYGVDPMEFTVHGEWINRPSTIIVDPEGIVSFAYYGTFWGDRPSIKQTLEMVKSNVYKFEHHQRRKPVTKN